MLGIPPVKPTDAEDIVWGLQTAETLWKRGERIDALVWLRRAALAAGEAGDDDRALELARSAAELSDWMAKAPSVAPPARSAAQRSHGPGGDVSIDVEMDDSEGMPAAAPARAAPPMLPQIRSASQPTMQTAPPVFPEPRDQQDEGDGRSSVLPADRVHAGMFNPWDDRGSSLPVTPVVLQPPPAPPPPPPAPPPPEYAEDEEEVITSVRPQQLQQQRAEALAAAIAAGAGAASVPPPSLPAPVAEGAKEAPKSATRPAPPRPPPLPPGAMKPRAPRPPTAARAPIAPRMPPPPSSTEGTEPPQPVVQAPLEKLAEPPIAARRSTPVEEVPPPPAPSPSPSDGPLDLDTVEAFADLPDDARRAFASAAQVSVLGEGEEVSSFALAYIMSGSVDVAATMVDAPAARLEGGAVLRSRGTTHDGVPMRLIGVSSGVVATWTNTAVEEAFRTCPWVEEDLRVAANRLQTLVGVTIGPLGERLDASIREQIIERLTMRTLIAGEVVVTAGEQMPGLLLVGIGELELVDGDKVAGVVGSGEFLFPTEVLGAGNAPNTARAGAGGALILFGDRMVAQELLVTCPPLLEVFAGM